MAKVSARGSRSTVSPISPDERQAPVDIIRAWWAAGRLPAAIGLDLELRLLQESRRPWALPDPVRQRLHTSGANQGRVMKILRGQVAPNINAVGLYRRWRLLRQEHGPRWRARRKAIVGLSRFYEGLDRAIWNDPVLSQALKTRWRREYQTIKGALQSLKGEASLHDHLPPWEGYSVGIEKDLSRHGFWTPVIVALVKELRRSGISLRQAFRDGAYLLSSAFPEYPDKPNLVMRRYYHARRSRPSASPSRR